MKRERKEGERQGKRMGRKENRKFRVGQGVWVVSLQPLREAAPSLHMYQNLTVPSACPRGRH